MFLSVIAWFSSHLDQCAGKAGRVDKYPRGVYTALRYPPGVLNMLKEEAFFFYLFYTSEERSFAGKGKPFASEGRSFAGERKPFASERRIFAGQGRTLCP